MENTLYKMMIVNAANHLKSIDPLNSDEVNMSQIVNVLSIVLCKIPDDIASDIVKVNLK